MGTNFLRGLSWMVLGIGTLAALLALILVDGWADKLLSAVVWFGLGALLWGVLYKIASDISAGKQKPPAR